MKKQIGKVALALGGLCLWVASGCGLPQAPTHFGQSASSLYSNDEFVDKITKRVEAAFELMANEGGGSVRKLKLKIPSDGEYNGYTFAPLNLVGRAENEVHASSKTPVNIYMLALRRVKRLTKSKYSVSFALGRPGTNVKSFKHYVIVTLLYDRNGKVAVDGSAASYYDKSSLKKEFALINQGLGTLPSNPVSATVALSFFVYSFADYLNKKIGTDGDARELGMDAYLSMVIELVHQSVYAAVIDDNGSAQISTSDLKSIIGTGKDAKKYRKAVDNWSWASGWDEKHGWATNFKWEGKDLRAWKPVLKTLRYKADGTKPKTLSFIMKFDRKRTATRDDHIIVSGLLDLTKKADDKSNVLQISAYAHIHSADGLKFSISRQAQKEGDTKVFGKWKEALYAKAESTNSATLKFADGVRRAIKLLIRDVVMKQAEKQR